MSTRAAVLRAVFIALTASSFAQVARAADPFSYATPGTLVAGSGRGRADNKVYVPGMRFPIENGPAFANSQVWGHGGSNGPGAECDKENFSYPWHDNYCETRSWDMPLCPSGQGHQGQDIRAASCMKGVHWTVAVVDGTITHIGSYTVYITAADGTRFDYLHQQDVIVSEGQKVKRGDHIGKVSNQFNGGGTTVHLHFNIRQNVAGVGSVFVPTYLSLVRSYEALLGIADAGAPDAASDASMNPPDPTAGNPPVTGHPPTTTEPEHPGSRDATAESDSGCTAGPVSGSTSSWMGAGLTVAALGMIAARRRRSRGR